MEEAELIDDFLNAREKTAKEIIEILEVEKNSTGYLLVENELDKIIKNIKEKYVG